MTVSDMSDGNSKGSNAQEAYDELLQRLRSGAISPEDRIVDKALAEELNMSRMPAREALLRLVNEGYLVGSTRGFRLPTLSVVDIMEIFEIRKLLEPRAAASAAVVLGDEAMAHLRGALQKARRALAAQSRSGMMKANTEFRMVWMEAVPNRRLVATISRFFDHVNAVRDATLHDPLARQTSVEILETLADGFERRDALYVHDQMFAFIEAARMRFIALQREHGASLGLDVA